MKNKRRIFIVVGILIVVMMGFLALWPGRKPEPSQASRTLVVAIENDIQTLDPISLADPYTSRIDWQMYEG